MVKSLNVSEKLLGFQYRGTVTIPTTITTLLPSWSAFALVYIDPNAAGMLSQILTPLLIMGAAAVTFLRRQIGAAFSSLLKIFRRRVDG